MFEETTSANPHSPAMMSDQRPAYFESIRVRWAQQSRAIGAAAIPIGEALTHVFKGFLDGGWKEIAAATKRSLAELPAEEQAYLIFVVGQVVDDLESRGQTLRAETASHEAVLDSFREAGAIAGETILAMHVAGESPEAVTTAASAMEQVLAHAYVAAEADRVSAAHGIAAEDLGPAVFAAARVTRDGDGIPSDVVRDLHLDRGARLPAHRLAEYAVAMGSAMTVARASVVHPVVGYDAAAATERSAGHWEGLPRIVGAATQARGGLKKDRLPAARQLIRGTATAMGLAGYESGDGNALDLSSLLECLGNLARAGREEEGLVAHIEPLWQKVDRNLEWEQRRAEPGVTAEVELPALPAPDARAMYLLDAARKGVPAGLLVSRLRDPRDTERIWFGPEESRYFECAIFSGSREYAATFAADSHTAVRESIQREPYAGPALQDALRDLERELREVGAAEIDEVADQYREEIAELVMTNGACTPDAAQDIAWDAVSRAAAALEISALTVAWAPTGTVPRPLIEDYSSLPHSAVFSSAPGSRVNTRRARARNGQTLADLREDVDARWRDYHKEAPPAQDVHASGPEKERNGDRGVARFGDSSSNPVAQQKFGGIRNWLAGPQDRRRSPGRPRKM